MGNGMNKILPGLFLGNFRDAKSIEELKKNGITHILAIHDSPESVLQEMVYLCIEASDNPMQDLTQHISACNDFIHKGRQSGGVLVHCLAGVSRSVAIVVAYLMTVSPLSFRECLSAVRGIRRCANPNMGFQRQLKRFEDENLKKEKDRLLSVFPDCFLTQDDITIMKDSIAQFDSFVKYGNSIEMYEVPSDSCASTSTPFSSRVFNDNL